MIGALLTSLGLKAAGGWLSRWWPYLTIAGISVVAGILWMRLDTLAAARSAAEAEARAATQREAVLRDSLMQTLDTLDAVEAGHARAIAALEAEATAAVSRARRSATLMEEVRNVADPRTPVSPGVGALIDGLRRTNGSRRSGDAGGIRPHDGAAAPADLRAAAASP